MFLCSAIAAGAGYGLALAEQQLRGGLDSLAPVPWALAVIGLSVAVPVATSALFWAVSVMRVAGWLRAVVLVASTVGLVWVPTALVAGAAAGGPVAEIYRRLGDPQAGRWASAGLGLLTWIVLAGPASGRSIAMGRAWMRVDGLDFRRRLVRVVAGWPSAAAVTALVVGGGWAANPLTLLWIAAAVAVLQLRTR